MPQLSTFNCIFFLMYRKETFGNALKTAGFMQRMKDIFQNGSSTVENFNIAATFLVTGISNRNSIP